MTSVEAHWFAALPAGLPSDFDYAVIRSVDDARSLMLVLPNCDRGRAAVGLYEHRWLVGSEAAYYALLAAWDHDEHEAIAAFGSAERFAL